MGFVTNILGEQRMDNFKLASGGSSGRQFSIGTDIKAIKPSVDFKDFEFAYKSDAITFSAINKSVQMIMAGGFKGFLSKNTIITKYKTFFEEIGEIGHDTTFEELFQSIFRDQMIYGNAFVEKIFDIKDEKIVDLATIDPKKIDYAKTPEGRIVLDKRGAPVGYMIKLETGTYSEGDTIPESFERSIKRESNEIFILAKRICHFKLYPIGDKFYGIGLIEPAYKSGIYKKNIEKGQANSIYSRGFSPLIAYVGSERRMATPNDIKGVLDILKTLDFKRYEALPDWVRVEPIKYEQSELTTTALKDLRTDQIAALSAPQALVSGSGEATNRATLGDQRVIWEFTLKDIIKQTLSYFKKYILKPINETNGFGGVPDMEWGELKAEDINNTADKIIRMLTAKSLHITPQMAFDLENELRQIMNIKEGEKSPPKTVANNNVKDNVGDTGIQSTKPIDKQQPKKE